MAQLMKPISVRDDLRMHSRYIRDTLVPLLSHEKKLGHSETALVHFIFRKLKSTPMTLDLLRYSRMEKALMVIVATGASCWPMDVVVAAEEMIQKWENQLGPLKDLRADLYGPDGKLEGLRKINTWEHGREERDDDAKSAWSVEGGVDPTRAYEYGHLGFEVGHWWLKPAAAFRDGIIDGTSHAITADDRHAYAIILNRNQAEELDREGHVRYHVPSYDQVVWKLVRPDMSDMDKAVRVLRSCKLRSKLAPKAGLRYDGLYRVVGWGTKPESHNSWHMTVELARIPDQPSIHQALCVPMADQLDDWKDYLHLKNIDRGKDFALLREIVSSPLIGLGKEAGTNDSGYFSRRGSKENTKSDKEGEEEHPSRRSSFKFSGGRDQYNMKDLVYEEEGGSDEDAGYSSSRRGSGQDDIYSFNRRGSGGDDSYSSSRRPSTRKSSLAATPSLQSIAEEAEHEHKAEEEEDPGYFSRQNSAVSADIESLDISEKVGTADSVVVKPSPVEGGEEGKTTPTAL